MAISCQLIKKPVMYFCILSVELMSQSSNVTFISFSLPHLAASVKNVRFRIIDSWLETECLISRYSFEKYYLKFLTYSF